MNSLHIEIKDKVWKQVREESKSLSNTAWAKIWSCVNHSNTWLCMIIRREAMDEESI